jgi:hypothetical protein
MRAEVLSGETDMSGTDSEAVKNGRLMTWLKGSVFGGTALGKGIRDGRHGLPAESHARPSHRTNVRLDFWEHERVDLADGQVADLCARWRKTKERLDGPCKMVRSELIQLLESWSDLRSEHRKKHFGELHRDVPLGVYLAYLVLAAAGEFPLNRAAFRILRVGSYETVAMAAGVAVISVTAAHGVGKLLRQWHTNGAYPFRRAMMCTGCVALAGVVATVGLLRHEYLEWANGDPSLLVSTALGVLSAVLLLTAVFASYFAHDSDCELEHLCSRRRVLASRIRRTWSRWNTLSGKYDRIRAVILEMIRRLHAETRALLDEYRRGDSATRAGGQVPTYFGEPIPDDVFRPIDTELTTELDPAPAPIDGVLKALGLDSVEVPNLPSTEQGSFAKPNGEIAEPLVQLDKSSVSNGDGSPMADHVPRKVTRRITPASEET